MLTIWPQSMAIFVGQGTFLLIFFIDFKRIFFLALIFLTYILINVDYLFYDNDGNKIYVKIELECV